MVIISNTDFIAPEGQYTIDRDNDPGMFKAYIPEFLYRPPYGYPRKEDLITIRKLAKTPYVHMIIRTIAQQVASTPWDIKVKEEYSEEDADYQEKIKGVKNFFRNPNGNQESFEDLMVAWVTDVLEIDSGVGIKVFNKNGRLTQLFARDGSTFLKNPDPFGYLGSRAEIIPPLEVDLTFASPKQDNGYMIDPGTVDKQKEAKLRNFYDEYLRPKAAFFQYGWTAGAMPVPFGKREVVWFQSNTRSDTVYGRSPVEVLGDVLFTLLYGSSYSLDMFIKNNIPAGVIQLIGAQQPQINAFRERFDAEFITKDVFSNNRHNAWKAPIANQEVKFTPFNFTSKEMEVLESQKWYLKIAAAVFGVTQDELGITEDSNKAVSMTQGGVFKRKAVQPILRLMQQRLNTQVMPEFGYDALEFVFDEYDIDEDMKKHNLLEQEIRMGVKTPEMVAAELGIDVNELKAGKEEARQERMEEESSKGYIGLANDGSSQEQDNFEEEINTEGKGGNFFGEPQLKYKYIRRTGGPGRYRYWYKDPKTGKVLEGGKPKEEYNKKELPKEIRDDLKNVQNRLNDLSKEYSSEGNSTFSKETKELSRMIKEGKIKEAVGKLLRSDLKYDIGRTTQELQDVYNYKISLFESTGDLHWGEKNEPLTAWRAGGITDSPTGVFFAYDKKRASAYSDKGKRNVQNHKIIPKNTLVANNMVDAYKQLTGKTDKQMNTIESKFESTGDYWLHVDKLVKKEALNNKYDSAVYTKAAAPAYREFVVFDNSIISSVEGKSIQNTQEEELKEQIEKFLEEQTAKAIELVNELPKDQLSKISVEGKALHDAIIGKILKLFNISVLGETIAKIVQHSYVNGIDEAEKQFNRNFLPDNKAIIAAQQLTFDNIKGATEEFKDKLRGIISRGVKEGRGAGEIATQIKDQLGVTITRAKTIARTELVSAYNDGSYQGAKDSGLLLDKVWDGHLDMRTSDICRSLNGVRIPLSESFEYEGKTWLKPPAHPNCRSRLRYIVKGEQDE